MAYTTINKGSDYFNTVLWTGDNTDNRSITGVGFQPDMVWQKTRNQGYSHSIFDNVRGVTNRLVPNDTAAETTVTDFKSFDSDGFTIDQDALQLNATGDTNVGWSWLGGGTASSNTDGTITSSVSANQTAGFSVVKTTGTLSSGTITVGHGLGVAPSMIFWKRTDGVSNWQVYHKTQGTNLLQLNTTGAVSSGSYWGTHSSTVFTVENALYGSGVTYIAYCFAEKKGYSKFCSYTGNGNADGTFVYTGFKPAFVMIKRTDDISEWTIYDTKRDTFNLTKLSLEANTADVEAQVSQREIDIYSNGFKPRGTSLYTNASGGTYIYMAFAENPLVTTGKIPATAR